MTFRVLQRLALLSTSFDVTVSGLQVLSTTWKSTDGTRSHWKYVVDNANVYRDVYRGSGPNIALEQGVSPEGSTRASL
jgi:hypothetical protein